ncbi:MAG: ABC transporter permease [Eubacterium sp.]|nr:ABC transporter permease [Eubacterium sp.]
MYSKLALKNVRRSVRDYTIYFLTLTFGVCIFYVFNAIDSQQAMLSVTSQQASVFKTLTGIMGYVSVFISIILAFLVLYANKFLIKRRKKELGIYMTLGMSRRGMSTILVLETLIIGIVSLAAGIVLGFFISEFMAVATAKLFEAPFIEFKFVFSPAACGKTVLYFGIIFVITMVFNTLSISRYKLIDLLSADRQNESFKAKKLWHAVVLFILSILCLGAAYYLILTNGMVYINEKFAASLILGCIGTLLFFMSLSGFLLRAVQANKRLYLRGLNMFVLRQLNSKINTTFVSMTVICIMLLMTIGTLSTGISLANTLTGSTEAMTPFDITITSNKLEAQEDPSTALPPYHDDITAYLNSVGFDTEALADTLVQTHTRTTTDTLFGTVLAYDNSALVSLAGEDTLQLLKQEPLTVISLSDFNKQLAALGKSPVALAEDQFLLTYDFPQIAASVNSFIEKNGQITVGGKTLSSLTDKAMVITTATSFSFGNMGLFVLPDAIADTLPVTSSQLSINYKDTPEAQAIGRELESAAIFDYSSGSGLSCADKEGIYTQNLFIKLTTTYLGIYIGFVFLIASAAILALQQLSEAADSTPRYALLKKIGVEQSMLRRALFTQIAIYFLLPLALAIVHSVVGIQAANEFVAFFGDVDVAGNSGIVAVILVLIYGAYFLATCLGSLSILKEKRQRV